MNRRAHSSALFALLFAVSLAAVFMVAAAPAAADEANWPAFRGADGTGRAVGALPPGDGPLRFEVRWKRPLGSGYSGVSVSVGGADGKLVTAAHSSDSDVVLALDPETGEELWRSELGAPYAGHDGSHDGPIATPAVADGRVFALGAHGDFRAYDLDDGSLLWQRHLIEDLGSEDQFYGFGGSPRVVGDLVLLQIGSPAEDGETGEDGDETGDETGEDTGDGSLAAFDVATGELRWRAAADGLGTQTPVVAEIGGRETVLVLGNESIAAVDPASGEEMWSLEHQGGRGAQGAFTSSPLLLDDGRVFLKHATPASTFLVASADGQPTLSGDTKAMARSYSPAAVWSDAIYGYSARFLSAADAASGELLWRSREPGDGFVTTVDGQLLVLTKNGTLHLGPASRDGWQETARVDLFDDLAWTPPSVAGASLYVRSLGAVARVDLVRAEAPVDLPTVEIPGQLQGLVADLADAEDPSAVVDAFLRDLDQRGVTPPLVDGSEVVFLWRGEAAGDNVPAIAGDMIGMRREEGMHRLEGTDLWWWATELDPRARVSYVFLIDDQPTLDPAHRRQHVGTVLGPDMNWQRADGVTWSWVAMPEWPGRSQLEDVEIEVQVPGREEGESSPQTVRARVWKPADYDTAEPATSDAEAQRYATVYVHDTDAIDAGGWLETLDDVVGRTTQPLLVVFVDPVRSPAWPAILAEQIVPAIDGRFRTRPERTARANVGMGFLGIPALSTTLLEHETFGVVGIQSLFGLEASMARIQNTPEDITSGAAELRIYQEWGRWDLISSYEEMNMRQAGRQVWSFLHDRGWKPMGGEVWDSTDWASWRNRTAVLLESLFPAEGDGPSPRLAPWLTGTNGAPEAD